MTFVLLGLLALGCGGDDDKGGGDHAHDHDHDHHGDDTLPDDFDDSTQKTTESGIVVSYTTNPAVIVESEEFGVIITHSGGTVVEADATMPTHGGHGMNVYPERDDDGAGTVVASPFQFHMPGYWELFIQLETADGDVETVRFDMACCD